MALSLLPKMIGERGREGIVVDGAGATCWSGLDGREKKVGDSVAGAQ